MDRCMLTFRAVHGSTASRPVVKQYDNADPNMMRHELAAGNPTVAPDWR